MLIVKSTLFSGRAACHTRVYADQTHSQKINFNPKILIHSHFGYFVRLGVFGAIPNARHRSLRAVDSFVAIFFAVVVAFVAISILLRNLRRPHHISSQIFD